jgi:hypothetical protein
LRSKADYEEDLILPVIRFLDEGFTIFSSPTGPRNSILADVERMLEIR